MKRPVQMSDAFLITQPPGSRPVIHYGQRVLPTASPMPPATTGPPPPAQFTPAHKRTPKFIPVMPGLTLTALLEALEPFTDVDGEGDEDFADDTPVTVKFGRTTHYALRLGDFRRARAAFDKATGDA